MYCHRKHQELWLCPLRWAVSSLVLREQPQHCLSHTPVSGGWVRAMLWLSVPRRMTPVVPPIVAQGAWVWVPLAGEQEVCGPLWQRHGGICTPHAGPGSCHPRRAALALVCEGQPASTKAPVPSCQSLAAPSVTLSGFSSLQICFWSLSERLPTPFLTPPPGWR